MSSQSQPPILPISNPQTTTTTTTNNNAQSQVPVVATPALRAFITRLTDSARLAFSQRRPWAELIDRSAFSRPESFSDALSRVRKNYPYFRINYMALVAAVVAVSLLTHPVSLLFLFFLLASWVFLYLFRPSDSPLVLFGRTFSDNETLLGLLGLSVVVIFLTSVGSLLISAVLVGSAIVFAHGAFRVPEDLFLDEQEPASTGLLSFLGGAASSAAASAPPVGVARV